VVKIWVKILIFLVFVNAIIVKFNDFLPGYLAEVLADIPKVNIAVSKYVLCLNTI
jgi:hypothetical protein